MDADLLALARATPGFMPDDEGLALHRAALEAARHGPIVEIGTYCGKSSIYLAAAARERGTVVFTVDHHRGSEENQPGEQYHDDRFFDPLSGGLDTLPEFRRTMTRAKLDDVLVAVVGRSSTLARHWHEPLGGVFIDGGHSEAAGCCPSTTSSRIPRTAGARPTTSTCGRWRAAPSARSRGAARCACYAVSPARIPSLDGWCRARKKPDAGVSPKSASAASTTAAAV